MAKYSVPKSVVDKFNNNPDVLLEAHDISMVFKMPTEKIDNIKEYFIKFVKRQIHYQAFKAVDNVNISVKRGQSLALIGRNGAGKSTLLRIMAGILEPTNGKILSKGNIVPLLKLGAGFDYNASGKENIFLNGAMLGYSHKEMEKRYDSIVEFSELGDFINVPLKNYSSGMVSRLGFAIAFDVNPDLMLIDEVLGVGDIVFRKKCAKKIDELKQNGTTFIIVSHSTSQVKELCQQAIYLDHGNVVSQGDIDTVVKQYVEDCNKAGVKA